jgi:hypothetical protein
MLVNRTTRRAAVRRVSSDTLLWDLLVVSDVSVSGDPLRRHIPAAFIAFA